MDLDNKKTAVEEEQKKPGIMFYFDALRPIKALPLEDIGRLTLAMLEYGEFYILPQFEGMLALAWGFIQPRIDKDDKEYKLTISKRKYAAFCRERKKKGEPEISFEEWLVACDGENHHMISHDTTWYPTTTSTTNTTTITTTAAAATTITNAPEGATAAAEVREGVKPFGGELGKGVVFLTDEQMEELLDRMGLDTFNHYVEQLSGFILREGARPKNHYETILKWWREDSALRGGGGP